MKEKKSQNNWGQIKSTSKSIFKSNISVTILNVNIWNASVKSKEHRIDYENET